MTPTRLWVLAVIVAVCALLAWLVLREVYASLPPLPWTAAVAMVLLGVAEAVSGRNLRARIHGGRGLKPVAPLAAVRMAALGKASSHAAAVIGGLAIGFLVYLTSSLSKSVPRNDAFAAGGTVLAAVVLLLGALYLENSCRVPTDDEHDNEPTESRRRPQPPAPGAGKLSRTAAQQDRRNSSRRISSRRSTASSPRTTTGGEVSRRRA